MKRRNAGQDAYEWWAKMTLDDIKAIRAVIEAAKLSDKLADAIECGEDVTDVQLQDAVGQLRQAVRALTELEGK